MTSSRLETLSFCLQNVMGDKLVGKSALLGELTISVRPVDLLPVMQTLRDHPELRFEMLIDLCGMDYASYGSESGPQDDRIGKRFAVVYHLLSLSHNHRLRLKAFADDDEFPVVDSVLDIWPAANWFERKADSCK